MNLLHRIIYYHKRRTSSGTSPAGITDGMTWFDSQMRWDDRVMRWTLP